MTKLCVLFPGQGSQYVGMGQRFFDGSQKIFKDADEILGFSLSKIMLEGPLEELTKTQYAQPAILLHSILAFRKLSESHEPVVMLGHSLGEYSALVASGVISLEEGLKLVHKRGLFMAEACHEKEVLMAAIIGLTPEEVTLVMEEFANENETYADVANFNSPNQTVISGTKKGVLLAKEALMKKGAKKIVELNVSAPFHCKLMKPAALKMQSLLDNTKFSQPSIPIVSNISVSEETDSSNLKSLMVKQMESPVRFTQCVEHVANNHPHLEFFEVGPKRVLCSLVKKIIPDSQVDFTDK